MLTHKQIDSIVSEWVNADRGKRAAFLLTTEKLDGDNIRIGNAMIANKKAHIVKGLIGSMIKEKEVADVICYAAASYIDITDKETSNND